jgi:endonuclease III
MPAGAKIEGAEQSPISKLIAAVGGRFSTELGIDLEGKNNKEIFKWFLAAILFGARIGEPIAIRTYQEFARRRVITPKAILNRGWDGLVEILDEGGYVRYDFKTATKLLEIAEKLEKEYQGDLNLLHDRAEEPGDLEAKLLEFKGVGPITVNIFLRELRGIWEKAEPLPSDLALLAAGNLGLIETEDPAFALEELQQLFQRERERATLRGYYSFPDLESALVRLGKGWCRKGRHDTCPMRKQCPRMG